MEAPDGISGGICESHPSQEREGWGNLDICDLFEKTRTICFLFSICSSELVQQLNRNHLVSLLDLFHPQGNQRYQQRHTGNRRASPR
jgi:hypothetical protein